MCNADLAGIKENTLGGSLDASPGSAAHGTRANAHLSYKHLDHLSRTRIYACITPGRAKGGCEVRWVW